MAKIKGWSKRGQDIWKSDNRRMTISLETISPAKGSKPGTYRVNIEDPTTTTRLGPYNSKKKARDKAKQFMRNQQQRSSSLPDIKWAKSAREENLEWVSVDRLRPNQLEDWYTEEELRQKGWIQERADDAFYPIPVTPRSNIYTVNDGHHRVSYAIVKGEDKVLVERPTEFKVKISGRDKTATRYGWKYIPENHPKIGGMNVNKRRRHLKEDVDEGHLDWVKEDGEIIYD